MVAVESGECRHLLVKLLNFSNLKWPLISNSHRPRHRSTWSCRRDRRRRMRRIHCHPAHTHRPTIRFWCSNTTPCHPHRRRSRSSHTVRRHSCRHRRNSTRPWYKLPSKVWIKMDWSRCAHKLPRHCRDERVVRTKSAERCTAWIIVTHGALNANGRRHVVALVTENYWIISNMCCPLR